jgi:hypothetical protein
VVLEAGVGFDESAGVWGEGAASFLNWRVSARVFVKFQLVLIDALCLMKFRPMQRMIGTSSTVTGPRSFLTVTSSSVTLVAASKMSLFAMLMTLAFSPVDSVVVPISKSGEGRIG